jgi:hypothetical protein
MNSEDYKLIVKVDDTIPALNAGGCAIFALALYRYLKNNDGLVGDEKFVYVYSTLDLKMQNDGYLEGKNKNPTSCSHCYLYHNGYYYDSTGKATELYLYKQYRYIHEIDVELEQKFMVESINQNVWNHAFRREIYVSKLSEMLEVDLDDVKY